LEHDGCLAGDQLGGNESAFSHIVARKRAQVFYLGVEEMAIKLEGYRLLNETVVGD
jgi:hypothetical protein